MTSPDPDDEFEYRGYRIRIDVREISGEIDSGVYVSTATCWRETPGGKGDPTYLEKNHHSIHLSPGAARQSAIARARAALDRLIG